jgi:purine/pyrimidine-nucleoside phosphorylase
MSSTFPAQYENVTAIVKANVYFDGKVISHTLLFQDGSKKTLGLIYPGSYCFTTDAPERMAIVAGSCRIKIAGQNDWKEYKAGEYLEVARKSSFEIHVDQIITEYICSYIQ